MALGLRIWILIVALAIAVLSISPSFQTGIAITSVERNSTAFNEGLRQGMEVRGINGVPVQTIEEYGTAIGGIFTGTNESKKITFTTNQGDFIFFTSNEPEITVGKIPQTRIKTGLDL